MPELPEVETIRRQLASELTGKTVRSVLVRTRKMVRGSATTLVRTARRARVTAVGRRAKYIYISLTNGYTLLLHLKMTGQLIYRRGRVLRVGGHPIANGTVGLPNRYTHVIVTFTDGGTLYFNDQRRFGFLQLIRTARLEEYFTGRKLGPEPLSRDFTLAFFTSLCSKRRNTTIKQLLMDQTAIAGIGNIYAAEACFYAKVRPMRKARTLTAVERRKLYQGIRAILPKAIAAQGSSADAYVDAYGTVDGDVNAGTYVPRLKVYGRAGQPCLRCRSIIKTVRLGGRGSAYCPGCQR